MIIFNSENEFELTNKVALKNWITSIILAEGYSVGELNFIFCNDDYLHKINIDYLNHDTLTDVISFDYTTGKKIKGDIFISTDRVNENAHEFNVPFNDELYRVMIHGVLHFLGYKDKEECDRESMRMKEDSALSSLRVILN